MGPAIGARTGRAVVAARAASALLAVCATLLVAAPAAAEVSCAERLRGRPDARVLLPSAGDALSAAFRGAPSLRLESASLVCDEVQLRVCPPEGDACATVRLTDADAPCARQISGPFCVVGDGDPLLAAVRAAVAGLDERTIWTTIEEPEHDWDQALLDPDTKRRQVRWDGRALAWLLAALWLAVPWGLGVLLGRLLRGPLARAGRAGPPLVGLALWAPGFGVAALVPTLSSWEPIGVAAVLALSTALAARPKERHLGRLERRVLLGSIVLSLLLGEAAVRLFMPPPPSWPPPESARLVFSPERREGACLALYPAVYPEGVGIPEERLAEPGPRVLHIGDSMLEGLEVDERNRFTHLMNEVQADTVHLNAGHSGTGPDHQLQLLRTWLPRLAPKLVVLYSYGGNDLTDIDGHYSCCDAGPLLDEDLAFRCPEPRWRFPLGALLARSPAPYPARVAASVSDLAAHFLRAFGKLTHVFEPGLAHGHVTEDHLERLGRYRQLLAAIDALVRESGARLIVVVIPYRTEIEGGPAGEPFIVRRFAIAQVARDLGIELLDPTDALQEAARDGMEGLYARDFGYNEHFGERGHAVMAQWLLESLSKSQQEPEEPGRGGER